MAAGLARFEWILIELIVLGLLIWQFVSIRRAVRRDREEAAKDKQAAAPKPPEN
jgi:hypothetical protein